MATSIQNNSPSKDKSPDNPEPLIVHPLNKHTQTLIFLHGRGSNGPRFGPTFLASPLSPSPTTPSISTLPQLFPGMKFIFPTASKRRATIYKRIPICQWFDNWSLEDTSLRSELQYEGIKENSEVIKQLIEEEAGKVGMRNVFFGGLSQGCAMSLCVLLNYSARTGVMDQGLGGFIGMSGWLPLARDLNEAIQPHPLNGEDSDDPFESSAGRDDREENPRTWQIRAANFARDVIDLPELEKDSPLPLLVKTPIFLGHGKHDEKVRIGLGREARDVLLKLGLDVIWKEYDEGHWYKIPNQIDDIAVFLRKIIAENTST